MHTISRPRFSVLLFATVMATSLLFTQSVVAAVPGLINPKGFGYVYADYPAASNYTASEVDITVEADGSPNGYFFGHAIRFVNGTPTDGSYIGLQTGAGNGKLAIFSLWNATSATSPGVVVPFSTEGTGYSTKIAYDWQVGTTYRVRIGRLFQTTTGDSWGGWVTNLSTGQIKLIGQIKAPANITTIKPSTIDFHERYAGAINSCRDLIKSKGTFTNQRLNDGSTLPTTRRIAETTDVPACQMIFKTIAIPNGGRSVIGGLIFADKTTNTFRLNRKFQTLKISR